MSSAHTTVLLVVPGRRTVSLELPPHWPAALGALLLVPLMMGAVARHCADALHGVDREVEAQRVVARDVTGSLSSASASPAVVARVPAPAQAPMFVAAAQAPVFVAAAQAPVFVAAAQAPVFVAAAQARPPVRVSAPSVVPTRDELSSAWLRVQALHLGESIRVRPFDAEGALDSEAVCALRHLMRCRITGREVEIDPKLVRILAAIGATYNRPIQLVSGHRQPHVIGTSSTSQHTLGKAADIRVAGVPVEELRALAIKLGARGLGVYPEKGFVHVDVRDKKYSWTYTQADGEVRDMH